MSLSITALTQQDYDIFCLTDNSPENNVWACDCYVVKANTGALVIDPGYTRFDEARRLLSEISVVEGIILLTHGHWEHYNGAFDLLSNGFSKMYVPKEDHRYINDLITLIKRGESNSETNKKLSKSLSGLHGVELNLKLNFLPANPNELNNFEKKIIYFDDGFRQLEYGGVLCDFQHDGSHTKGHTIYRIGRMLFAGDLVLLKDGKLKIEPRLDHKETENGLVAREIRCIRKATKRTLNKIINNKDSIDYIAMGHGGFMQIGTFVEKARRLVE